MLIFLGSYGSTAAFTSYTVGGTHAYSTIRSTFDIQTTSSRHRNSRHHVSNLNTPDYKSIMSESETFTRRGLLQSGIISMGLILTTSSPSLAAVTESIKAGQKILVLGGTGLVGSEVCKILAQLKIPYIATSRDGRNHTVALDFTPESVQSPNSIATRIQALAEGCTAVISTVGSIGTPNDELVNAASGIVAQASKAVGVKRFVYVSVSPQVKDSTKDLHILDSYMKGKASSEDSIKKAFDSSGYTIIQPTFIYGGSLFAINPPRVNEQYGSLVEGLLSSGPFRTLANVTPGLVSVALQPPISAHAVAGACVAGALGVSSENKLILNSYDAISDASKLI